MSKAICCECLRALTGISTGIIGSTAVLHALIRRAEEGGSYGVDVSNPSPSALVTTLTAVNQVALNYYSQWLIQSVGTYPQEVWSDVWKRHNSLSFRHYHSMAYTLPAMFKSLAENVNETLYRPEFFERRKSKAVGREFLQVKPIAQFEDEVKLEYNVGTRSNGVDKPRWPDDLRIEIIV